MSLIQDEASAPSIAKESHTQDLIEAETLATRPPTPQAHEEQLQPDEAPPIPVAGKGKRKEIQPIVREAGKSLLPFSRVQKIIKADKDIPIIARDATFLISLATEEFIKRLSEASQRVADREKRATVQHKDIATIVRKTDEFLFLEEIIPWLSPDPVAKRPKVKAVAAGGEKNTMLNHFAPVEQEVVAENLPQGDIVMSEDGTMHLVGSDEIMEENHGIE
ncbi:hypothetical protein BD779DRAFT_1668592 [Infundibulicybe gibba]|nr:hypothetical protein BD779DRAFT_1668592 [Infundibulicybe gibba]